ncbi:MAG: efflux transporter periplasmic adaptor subunit [Gammaproteobacteria bacterium]|nr:efflux transporter periplasmic adaptor subunit [Gammaproteobacteria bacterium]
MNASKTLMLTVAAAAAGFVLAWVLFGAGPAGRNAGAGAEREILYWVAPMDPNYRSDEPGKSPMGMDLVPVYADERGGRDDPSPGLRIDPVIVNNIGVKTAPVRRGDLHRHVETVGYVVPDADLVSHVHVRAEGWIERLYADTEGDPVTAGDSLFDIYSPALASAQDEYLQALRAGSAALIDAATRRLAALGMAPEQIEAVRRAGSARELFAVRAPRDGYLMELNVREGMYVQPGTTIMSLADLSEIWVDVDVFEQQIDWVRAGQTATMRLPFAPERLWQGRVDYVYPTIRPETRSARIRLTFDNPDLALKPNMYADVAIEAEPRSNVLYVPSQAVIRTGGQPRVILALPDGRFRPAQVETGVESEGAVEIRRGLAEDERIVVSGQFLIDSEASLEASLLRMLDEPSGAGHGMTHDGHMDHAGHMNHGGAADDMPSMDHAEHMDPGSTAPNGNAGSMDHGPAQPDGDAGHEHHEHGAGS